MSITFERGAYTGRFEFVGGVLCLDFANTINYAGINQNERLKGFVELAAWGCLTGQLTDAKAAQLLEMAAQKPSGAEKILVEARTLRLAIHHIFSAVAYGQEPEADQMAIFNAAMQRAAPHLQLSGHGGAFEMGWSAGEADLDQVLRPVIWSAAELMTSEVLRYVRRCQGAGCSWLFLDETRNHSRRWCNMAHCGNRAKASRHYARNKDIRA